MPKEFSVIRYDNPRVGSRCIRFAICRASARFAVWDSDKGYTDVCGRHLQMVLEDRLDKQGRLGNAKR